MPPTLRLVRDVGGYCAVPRATHDGLVEDTHQRAAGPGGQDGPLDAEDSERIAELPDDDPRSWVFSIYEWLGWIQESLLATQD